MKPTELDSRSAVTAVVTTTVLVFFSFMAIVGNTLVCLAAYRKRRSLAVTNIYIVALSLWDITVSVTVIPFSIAASCLREWPFGYNFAQFQGFIIYLWAGVSLYIFSLTALNRYICVVKPQRYPQLYTKKKAAFSTLFVLVFTLVTGVISIPTAYVVFIWQPQFLYCMAFWPDHSSIIWFFLWSLYLMLPFFLIVYCYGKVFLVVRHHNIAVIPSLRQNNATTTRAEEFRTCRILFASVIGFCVCWLPLSVFEILVRWVNQPALSVPSMFAYASAWINPLIYGAMNRSMRKEFLKILRCRKADQE